eukprot:1158212-Pelagomonas_calceolata.AAC.7
MQLVLLHCARSALCEAAESNAAQDGSPMPVRAREERACRGCALAMHLSGVGMALLDGSLHGSMRFGRRKKCIAAAASLRHCIGGDCEGSDQGKGAAYHVVPPCADPPLLLRVMPKLELPAKQMGNPSDKFNIRTSCCFKAKQT